MEGGFFCCLGETKKKKKEVRLKEGTFWLVGKVTRLRERGEALIIHHSRVGQGKITLFFFCFYRYPWGTYFTPGGTVKVLSLVFPPCFFFLFFFFLLK